MSQAQPLAELDPRDLLHQLVGNRCADVEAAFSGVAQPYLSTARGVESPTLLLRRRPRRRGRYDVFEQAFDWLVQRSAPEVAGWHGRSTRRNRKRRPLLR